MTILASDIIVDAKATEPDSRITYSEMTILAFDGISDAKPTVPASSFSYS